MKHEPCYNCGSRKSSNYNVSGTANGISLCDECAFECEDQDAEQVRQLEFEGKEIED